jgi:[protein-PII] uridylyltransferase
MSGIRKQRDIISGKALSEKLDALAEWSGYSPKLRTPVLETFKTAYQEGWNEIKRRFDAGEATAADAHVANAFLMDEMISSVHDFALKYAYPVANRTMGEQLAVVAIGGYGRSELAPYSDIDLMFLRPFKQTPHTEQVVEYILYMLWDMGLKVGHATRSVDDAIRLSIDDVTIRTSLLEARWLLGNKELFEAFEKRFEQEALAGTGADFVEAKLAERDARHVRMGDTRYVLEPNIKEGKGGLRDLQTLFWIANYLYRVDDIKKLVKLEVLTSADARQFKKAKRFLWTVRCHLHYLADRPEEHLNFNVQSEIGARMGYRDRAASRGVERFMKHYFLVAKEIGVLTRIICAVLEEQHKKRRSRFSLPKLSFRKVNIRNYQVDAGRLRLEHADDLEKDPVNMIRLFYETQRSGLDIHPDTLRKVTQNLRLIDTALRNDAEANRLFMDILVSDKDPETALKRMNEAGVLGAFIPDFKRIVAQMQYDMYHVFTVDEHTIRAIGVLQRIDSGEFVADHPVATQVIGEVKSRKALYLAVFLHDLAKGRKGSHSEIGAKLALKLGPRLGLSDWETETVSWLVLHHLDMSRIAFKRDVENSKTVSDFVEIVQSPERLRLLLILTVADIRAVGPGVWNGWKATLLRDLYDRAQVEMSGSMPQERRKVRVKKSQEALRERLADWDGADIDAHIAKGYQDYWLSFDTDTLVHHATLMAKAERENLDMHIETRIDPLRSATELIIYASDHPGLFAQVAGAMALSGASVLDAKMVTMSNGMVLDIFLVQDSQNKPYDNKARLKKLWRRMEDAVAGELYPAREFAKAKAATLPSRTRVFKVPPRVIVDNAASASHTVIELNGRDRPGFLYDVAMALRDLGLQIASAHISTYGERVVDVFYVKDIFGLKIEHEGKLNNIEERLLKAMAPKKKKSRTVRTKKATAAE